jgi:hypothetical protein
VISGCVICYIIKVNPQFSIRVMQLIELHPCWHDVPKTVIQDTI